MRSREFECCGCVAPLPKGSGAGLEEARGESFAYPIRWCEKSWGRRTRDIRWRVAPAARRKWPEAILCATRFSKTGGRGPAGVEGKACAGVRRVGRSFVSFFLRRVVAPAAGCQRRLG